MHGIPVIGWQPDGGIIGYSLCYVGRRAGGALAAPSTAFLYDWNMLPIGQAMWMKELETYKTFPSLQAPASYNLDQVIKAMQDAKHVGHASE